MSKTKTRATNRISQSTEVFQINYRNLRLITLVLMVAILTCIPISTFAQGNSHGNGNGNGNNNPPPVVLPIQYRVHYLLPPAGTTELETMDLSNTLLVVVHALMDDAVGGRIAYFYDHYSGEDGKALDELMPEA